MQIKGREYLEEDIGPDRVRLRMKPGGYYVDVSRQGVERWNSGTGYVQNVLSELDPEQREFLISGVDPEQFRKLFGEDE